MKYVFRISFAAVFLSLFLCMPATAASTDNFIIRSFIADYRLSRDQQKVSHLAVTERIVAQFPDFDQNHGILRAIPETYDGHSLDLKLQKVTDLAGEALPYETSKENDNLVLKIGDAARFVHGEQTYVITYTMSNVTKNFDDHDEFYWDVNGNQWPQATEYVAARLHFDEGLAENWTEPYAKCFAGSTGANDVTCQTHMPENIFTNGDKNTLGFETKERLAANQTLSFVVAFKKDTFVPYTIPLQTILLVVAVGGVPPITAFIFMVHKWRKYGRDPKGKGALVPEYLPPKDLSVLASSLVLKEGFQVGALSAQIIDLAVRHYYKIYEVKESRKLLPDKTHYEIELVKNPTDLRTEELVVTKSLFGKNPQVGDRVNIKELTNKLYKEAEKVGKQVDAQVVAAGYFKQTPAKAKMPYIIAGAILVAVGFIVIPWTLGVLAAGIIVLVGAGFMPARTQKGVDMRDYLLGLKMYMKLTEAERLKVLQSPKGALTEKIDAGDKTQLVKLYEKLLPYAMLFGIEKEWAKQFAELYTQSPDWYSGSGAFQAAYFATAMHSFSMASTATFTSPSNSSSSGFSGGFSGGGGGGGGGGGW